MEQISRKYEVVCDIQVSHEFFPPKRSLQLAEWCKVQPDDVTMELMTNHQLILRAYSTGVRLLARVIAAKTPAIDLKIKRLVFDFQLASQILGETDLSIAPKQIILGTDGNAIVNNSGKLIYDLATKIAVFEIKFKKK
jgi:hypothetical protein